MAWLDEPGFERRPLVFVEDHLYHTADLLAAVAAVRPDLVACATAVAIDRPGPDTDATIDEWRKLALSVVRKVPAGFVEFEPADVRRVNLAVSLTSQMFADEFL